MLLLPEEVKVPQTTQLLKLPNLIEQILPRNQEVMLKINRFQCSCLSIIRAMSRRSQSSITKCPIYVVIYLHKMVKLSTKS